MVGSVSKPMLTPGALGWGWATCSFQLERRSQRGWTENAVSNCLRRVIPWYTPGAWKGRLA